MASVELEFDPRGLAGRVDSKLSIQLQNPLDELETFTHWHLTATVSRQAVLNATAPVAPFKPLRAKPRRGRWTYGLHGERLVFHNSVIWTEELPAFDIPGMIAEAIQGRNLDEQEDALDNIMPQPTTKDTHATYWSTLLFVEELQAL